jgi:hypothetical protein
MAPRLASLYEVASWRAVFGGFGQCLMSLNTTAFFDKVVPGVGLVCTWNQGFKNSPQPKSHPAPLS